MADRKRGYDDGSGTSQQGYAKKTVTRVPGDSSPDTSLPLLLHGGVGSGRSGTEPQLSQPAAVEAQEEDQAVAQEEGGGDAGPRTQDLIEASDRRDDSPLLVHTAATAAGCAASAGNQPVTGPAPRTAVVVPTESSSQALKGSTASKAQPRIQQKRSVMPVGPPPRYQPRPRLGMIAGGPPRQPPPVFPVQFWDNAAASARARGIDPMLLPAPGPIMCSGCLVNPAVMEDRPLWHGCLCLVCRQSGAFACLVCGARQWGV